MSIDPTEDEQTSFASITDALSVDGTEHPRIIGNLQAADFDTIVREFKIQGHGDAAQVKMAGAINQTDDTEVDILDEQAIKNAYMNYHDRIGAFPLAGEELSRERQCTVWEAFRSGGAPYTDMAVWGPHLHRIQKKIKLRGVKISPTGGATSIELTGPADFEDRRACYAVFEQMRSTFAAFMSDAGGNAGHSCIYQADDRARLELAERLRRTGKDEKDRADATSTLHNFDAAMPWGWVWARLASDVQFCLREVQELAVPVLARAASLHQMIDHDAPIKQPAATTVECTERDARNNCRRMPRLKHQCGKCFSIDHGLQEDLGGCASGLGLKRQYVSNQGTGRLVLLQNDHDSTQMHDVKPRAQTPSDIVDANSYATDLDKPLPNDLASYLKFLYLFSGPSGRRDGFVEAVRGMGASARRGLRDLAPEGQDNVKKGALLALRASDVLIASCRGGAPTLNEQPYFDPEGAEGASMRNPDEFQSIRQRDEVSMHDLVHCEYGATAEKRSSILAIGVDLTDAFGKCSHGPRWWRRPSTGERHLRPRPPLVGKEKLVPAGGWRRSMPLNDKQCRSKCSRTPFLTSSAQPYPAGLNMHFAEKLAMRARQTQGVSCKARQLVKVGKIQFSLSFPGDRTRDVKIRGRENELYIGGVRYIIEQHLDANPHIQMACLEAIGSDAEAAGPGADAPDEVATMLGHIMGTSDAGGAASEMCSTPIRAGLVAAWARQANDIDGDYIEDWLKQGAPAGIEVGAEGPGIFPRVDAETSELGHDTLDEHDDEPEFRNYSLVDGGPEAKPEVDRLKATGCVAFFKSYKEACAWIGAKPDVSMLGMITNIKNGKVKRRLILDCKQSGVNATGRQKQKIVLPRLSDVIDDAIYLLRECQHEPQKVVEWLVLDFTDWFYNIPLKHVQRRHFVAYYGGEFIIFLTMAQGSVNAPLVRGRVAALVARLTQSMFRPTVLRHHTYVGGPIISVRGNLAQRDIYFAIIILARRTLGLKFAFRTAERGQEVDWIGARLSCKVLPEPVIEVTAAQDIVDDARQMIATMRGSNVAPVKDMQSLVGKANHLAGMIEAWRPFPQDMWSTIAAHTRGETSSAPRQCVWAKQITQALEWIHAFLSGTLGSLSRVHRARDYFGCAERVAIITDASPGGLGGYIMNGDQVKAYFTSPLTQTDAVVLRAPLGWAAGQQIWEALAML
ncbi:unnamed protein product [Prorocentrum cordatum]|uniref:RNA-directed RNA polymerase n=1 Tax=Prorocentrum cordatum TaxID=2364126 RepID=A0ABN9QRZ0_9DINO|nr:unnamed protein product [Polarella glacialis]